MPERGSVSLHSHLIRYQLIRNRLKRYHLIIYPLIKRYQLCFRVLLSIQDV